MLYNKEKNMEKAEMVRRAASICGAGGFLCCGDRGLLRQRRRQSKKMAAVRFLSLSGGGDLRSRQRRDLCL
jgi:hypothetical protein